MQTLGLFYSLSKHNRYLAAILQGIHQAVIVVDGNALDGGCYIATVKPPQ